MICLPAQWLPHFQSTPYLHHFPRIQSRTVFCLVEQDGFEPSCIRITFQLVISQRVYCSILASPPPGIRTQTVGVLSAVPLPDWAREGRSALLSGLRSRECALQ